MSQNLNRFFRIYLRLAALTLVVCTLLRIVLLFNEQTSELGFGFLQWVAVFGLGALNDLCALTLGYVFLWLFLLTLSKRKYDRPTGYVLLGVLTAAFCYVAFCNTIFDEYGSAAPLVATIVLGYWAGSFALRLFVPRLQPLWSKGWLAALLAIYVGAILFNAVSEYYFWNEFGVRYNFIAVDYLVYTNEVMGNIMESGDADRRADRRRHVVALPPRHPRRRGVQNRRVETRRLADLSGHGGRRPVDAALQHAVPDERQRLLQRIAGQRTL